MLGGNLAIVFTYEVHLGRSFPGDHLRSDLACAFD
jgi:hypothetical protein